MWIKTGISKFINRNEEKENVGTMLNTKLDNLPRRKVSPSEERSSNPNLTE